VLHRSVSVAAVAAALVLGACGGNDDSAADGQATTRADEQAEVLVTQDCGKTIVLDTKEVPPGRTALQALDQVADIETDDAGKFVTAIEGVEQDTDKQLAWLFYVNGEMAEVGAAEVKLKAGDVEWWDLHNWDKNCRVPPQAR
jgi:hypothetical protein